MKERIGPRRRSENAAKVWKEPLVSIYVGVTVAILLAFLVKLRKGRYLMPWTNSGVVLPSPTAVSRVLFAPDNRLRVLRPYKSSESRPSAGSGDSREIGP